MFQLVKNPSPLILKLGKLRINRIFPLIQSNSPLLNSSINPCKRTFATNESNNNSDSKNSNSTQIAQIRAVMNEPEDPDTYEQNQTALHNSLMSPINPNENNPKARELRRNKMNLFRNEPDFDEDEAKEAEEEFEFDSENPLFDPLETRAELRRSLRETKHCSICVGSTRRCSKLWILI